MSITHLLRSRPFALPARLARERRGAALVEFAFVAGPLLALIIASIQTSLVYFAQQNLETATEKTVRQLVTGEAQTANMTQAQFQALACSKLPAFMKCANLMVDVQTASSFSSVTLTAPTLTYDSNGNVNNSFQYKPGASGEINIVRVMYIWNVSTGPLGFDLSTLSTGKRLLMATSVFKSEPYSS